MSGPVVQSLQITFRVLLIGIALVAVGWCFSNVRQVPSDAQAVVLRFGRIVRVQPAGLLLAWPRPMEQVELLPAPARQMEMKVVARGAGGGPGGYLTGDGGQVLLDATLTWRITDPEAYLLARDHVAPALQRLFVAATTGLAAARSIDDFMAVRAVGGGDVEVQQQRQAIRGDLERAVNQRLGKLAESGASLGVEVTRADVDALLPEAAKPGFDAVLEATQLAEQARASARTDAERTLQSANRERDRLLASARGAAAERVADASVQVAQITALAGRSATDGRAGLLQQLWRDRVATVLQAAGSVVAIDPNGGTRVILPATQP
jgi:regulator of protease activity HflC (stomatin/prohibitin superfamily)